jgi:hypothetical protein
MGHRVARRKRIEGGAFLSFPVVLLFHWQRSASGGGRKNNVAAPSGGFVKIAGRKLAR